MDTPLSGVSGLCRRRRVGRSVAAGAILPHTAHGHRLRNTLPRRAQSSSAAFLIVRLRSLSPANPRLSRGRLLHRVGQSCPYLPRRWAPTRRPVCSPAVTRLSRVTGVAGMQNPPGGCSHRGDVLSSLRAYWHRRRADIPL